MKLALQQSKQEAEQDQKRREAKYGGNAQYQAMSETDGFNLAMKLSQNEGSKATKPKEKKKPKPTPETDDFQ